MRILVALLLRRRGSACRRGPLNGEPRRANSVTRRHIDDRFSKAERTSGTAAICRERGLSPAPPAPAIPASVIVRTPSSVALRAFDPASAPTTTRSVFFETLSVTFAPSASARALASGRVIVSSVPVNTSVLPAIALSAAATRAASSIVSSAASSSSVATLRGFAEEIRQFLGDRRADADDAAEFLACFRPHDGRRQHLRAPVGEAAVMPRQQARVGLADAADAERVDEALQRNVPPRLDRARQVARRHLAPAFAFGDLRLSRAGSWNRSAGLCSQPSS